MIIVCEEIKIDTIHVSINKGLTIFLISLYNNALLVLSNVMTFHLVNTVCVFNIIDNKIYTPTIHSPFHLIGLHILVIQLKSFKLNSKNN